MFPNNDTEKTNFGAKSMALHRTTHDRIIGGVCGGIARSLDWDPTLVRIGYVLLSVLSVAFPGLLVYIVLWIIMPQSYEY